MKRCPPPTVNSAGPKQAQQTRLDNVPSFKTQADNSTKSKLRSRFGSVSFKPSMPSCLKNTWLYKKFLNCIPLKYSVRFQRDLEALRNSSAVNRVRVQVEHHINGNEELIGQALADLSKNSPDGKLNLDDPQLVPNVLSKIGELEFKKLEEDGKLEFVKREGGELNSGVLEELDVKIFDVQSEAFKNLPEAVQRRIIMLRNETLKQLLKQDGTSIARAAGRKLPGYTTGFGNQPKFDSHYRNVANRVFKEVLMEAYGSNEYFKNQNLVDRLPENGTSTSNTNFLLID